MVDYEDAYLFAEENGCLMAEVSAKTGDNISKLFTSIANCIELQKVMENKALHAELFAKEKGCCK